MSALLAKTLKSSTLKRALIFIAVFGAIVVVLFSFVHGSTVSYVRNRTDEMIMSEVVILKGAYARGGRDALIGVIAIGGVGAPQSVRCNATGQTCSKDI